MRLIVGLALALTVCGASHAGDSGNDIAVVTSGERLDRDGLAERLRGADVVILGEVHDNPVHHQNQAWIVAQLSPAGLVAEMLQRADDDRIRDHLSGGGAPGGIGAVVGWEKSGWPEWEIYAPVFRALQKDAAIAGAAMPREEVRRVMTEPAAALIGDARLTPVLEQPLNPVVQAEAESEMIDSHCGHLPVDMAPMMVEAQRLRDASLTAAVLRLREATDGPLVVITGNGHARNDRGVPAMLAKVAPDLAVITVGQVEEGGDADPGEAPFDYVWTTARHERPDPCEKLLKRKNKG